MKTKSKLSFFTDKPYLIWAILFIIAPLLMVAYYALTDKTGAFSLASVEQIPTYITTITRNASYVDELSYQNLQLDDYFG